MNLEYWLPYLLCVLGGVLFAILVTRIRDHWGSHKSWMPNVMRTHFRTHNPEPGTGKTHTIHYLAKAVPDQTVFLIAAEQVKYLEGGVLNRSLLGAGNGRIADNGRVREESARLEVPKDQI